VEFVTAYFLSLYIGFSIHHDYGLNIDSQSQRADGGRAILCINEKLDHILLSKEKAKNYAERYKNRANETEHHC